MSISIILVNPLIDRELVEIGKAENYSKIFFIDILKLLYDKNI